MNAREHEYCLSLELRQVNDVLSCLLHSLLLHRTSAKFCCSNNCNCSLGSLGIAEVDCSYVDLTYVRLSSQELFHKVDKNIKTFRADLETNAFSSPRRTSVGSPIKTAVPLMVTTFSMEFFQIKKRKWPLPRETNTWERWSFVLDICKVANLDEFSRMKETVAESLSDIILNMCSTINRPQYLPKMPTRLEDVYDTSFSDCQPYNFRFLPPKTAAIQPQSSVIQKGRLLVDAFSGWMDF